MLRRDGRTTWHPKQKTHYETYEEFAFSADRAQDIVRLTRKRRSGLARILPGPASVWCMAVAASG